MLASVRETSRPRPPAKARRPLSGNKRLRQSASSPPPAYTAAFAGSLGRGLPHSSTEDGLASPTTQMGREDELESDDPWGRRGAGDEERLYREDEDDFTGWGRTSPANGQLFFPLNASGCCF